MGDHGFDDAVDDAAVDDASAEAQVSSARGLRGSTDASPAPSLFVWLLTLAAGISGLLFGCMYERTRPLRHHLPFPRIISRTRAVANRQLILSVQTTPE